MFVWYGHYWVRSLLLLRKRLAESLAVPPLDNPASTNLWRLLPRVSLATVLLRSTLVPSMVSSTNIPASHNSTLRNPKIADMSIPGVNSAGSAIGAAVCSWAADKFSRKHTIQGAALILIVGAALCAGADGKAMFLVGRVINGLGIGALVTAIPMYQAEVSTPESRGFMVSMHVSVLR
jgi:MFS family permease